MTSYPTTSYTRTGDVHLASPDTSSANAEIRLPERVELCEEQIYRWVEGK
jgi:hypothetical protein